MTHELRDPLTGESLDPDYGQDGGGPSDHSAWTRPLGRPEPAMPTVPSWRVAELRALPYTDYLETPEWRQRRLAIIWRARGKCERCLTRGRLDVHHRTYERLGQELPEDLEAICRPCHQPEHGVTEPVK